MGDLKVTYYDPKNPGSFGGVQSLSKVADQPVKEWLSGQETYTLHRPVRRNFQRRRIIVSGIDDQWQADLIDFTKLKKFNNGHTFVLIVMDVFSKFAWAEPLKNKTRKSVLKAFAKIVNRSGRKPLFLYTGRGLEFTNKLFQRWLKKKQIHFLTPQNQETKAVIAERIIRTLFVSCLPLLHIQRDQKIRRRASRLSALRQCQIPSQYQTKSGFCITGKRRKCLACAVR